MTKFIKLDKFLKSKQSQTKEVKMFESLIDAISDYIDEGILNDNCVSGIAAHIGLTCAIYGFLLLPLAGMLVLLLTGSDSLNLSHWQITIRTIIWGGLLGSLALISIGGVIIILIRAIIRKIKNPRSNQ